MVLLSAHPEGIPAMISRKVLVAAGAVSAATLFFGPAVASAESVTGVTGSAALATGSAGLAAGSAEAGAAAGAAGGLGTGSAALAAGSAEGGAALGSAEGLATGSAALGLGLGLLDTGSSAFDGGTSALVNIIDVLLGSRDLSQPEPAA